jgi:hypothetical protein
MFARGSRPSWALFVLYLAVNCLFMVPGVAALTFAFSPSRVLWAGGDYDSAAIVDGHFYLSTKVATSNCAGLGAGFGTVDVAPYGAASIPNLAGNQCSSATLGVFDPKGGNADAIVTRVHYRPTGLTLYVPQARTPLEAFSDEVRAGGLVNVTGGDRAFVLAVNEGAAGSLTIVVHGSSGEEIAREWVSIPDHGFLWYELATPFPAGSVVILPGLRSNGFGGAGWNTPATAPGEVWGWCFTGPDSGIVAPKVTPWEPVQRIVTSAPESSDGR